MVRVVLLRSGLLWLGTNVETEPNLEFFEVQFISQSLDAALGCNGRYLQISRKNASTGGLSEVYM